MKEIAYVICYPDGSPLVHLNMTGADGPYTVDRPCEADAVRAARDALFAALCVEAKADMPVVRVAEPVVEVPVVVVPVA